MRGRLVLACEDRIMRRNLEHRDEKIIARTPALLLREMRRVARENRSLDERIAKDTWELRSHRRTIDRQEFEGVWLGRARAMLVFWKRNGLRSQKGREELGATGANRL